MRSNNYIVYLWPGYGYTLHGFEVDDCSNECEALDRVVAKVIANNWRAFYLTVDEYTEMFAKELEEDEEYENDMYIYIDATLEGAPYPVYLNAHNLQIIKQ